MDLSKLRVLTAEHLRSGLAWLQSGGADSLYVLNRCLSPQQELIHRMLKGNGPQFDLSEFGKALDGEAQSWRILELARSAESGGLLHTFLSRIAEQLTDASIWQNMCSHTFESASDILRYSLRAAATGFQLLIARVRAFPLRLFLLLDATRNREEEAAKILSVFRDTPCLLDPFSVTHVTRHDTVDKLVSQESLLGLSAVATVFIGNIYNTETLHSKNYKRSRRPNTHAMSASSLAMWRQVSASPQWCFQEKESVRNPPPPPTKNVASIGFILHCLLFQTFILLLLHFQEEFASTR